MTELPSKKELVAGQLAARISLAPSKAEYDPQVHRGYLCRGKSKRVAVIRCAFHVERTPSLTAYTDGYICYGCYNVGKLKYLLKQLERFPRRDVPQRPVDDLPLFEFYGDTIK